MIFCPLLSAWNPKGQFVPVECNADCAWWSGNVPYDKSCLIWQINDNLVEINDRLQSKDPDSADCDPAEHL